MPKSIKILLGLLFVYPCYPCEIKETVYIRYDKESNPITVATKKFNLYEAFYPYNDGSGKKILYDDLSTII